MYVGIAKKAKTEVMVRKKRDSLAFGVEQQKQARNYVSADNDREAGTRSLRAHPKTPLAASNHQHALLSLTTPSERHDTRPEASGVHLKDSWRLRLLYWL